MMDLDHLSFLYNIFLLTKCTTTYLSLQEARETGALKEAKDKLEKKVEELTWRVQLEKRMRVRCATSSVMYSCIFSIP